MEQKCKVYAGVKNCLLLKIQGTKGWPDRVLLMPGGRAIFIEFKRFGKSLTPLQAVIMDIIKAQGFEAYEVDNFPMFKVILDERLSST